MPKRMLSPTRATTLSSSDATRFHVVLPTPLIRPRNGDISEEAKAFQPQNITKDKKKEQTKDESEQEIMSGGIEIEDLIPKVDELAEKGRDCPFGKLLAAWNEVSEAA